MGEIPSRTSGWIFQFDSRKIDCRRDLQIIQNLLQALDYVTRVDNFSFGTRLVNKWAGGVIMRMVGKSRAKMFDLPPRENLKFQLDHMSGGIKGDFFGGATPNILDFANFGILRSMEGLYGFDIVENHTSVWPWYLRMKVSSGI